MPDTLDILFESDSIWFIALPGLGRVYLAEHNQQKRTVICRTCGAELATGDG